MKMNIRLKRERLEGGVGATEPGRQEGEVSTLFSESEDDDWEGIN